MKRCNFMNFARNMKCLECNEARPKRQLTGGEWECPQCNFFNYGRNMACLRCDCKHPGDVSLDRGSNANKVVIDSRLAANEEKAQRWFSKISRMDCSSELNSPVVDEDFPEIMPLKKGVKRFVVSARKMPLERRLENAQYQSNLGNNGSAAGINVGSNNPSSIPSLVSSPHGQPKGRNSSYVPFVPLPADMISKKQETSKTEEVGSAALGNGESVGSKTSMWTGKASESNEIDSLQISEKPQTQGEHSDKGKEQTEKCERWFKRIAELHNITDLASAIPDEDFPEIMPMRKGENRFVVSKKKDRSLTSPAYKRQMAMEQANNKNYVPFVPFPPEYFARKDKPQSDEAGFANSIAGDMNSISKTPEKLPEKFDDGSVEVLNKVHASRMESQHVIPESRNWEASRDAQNENQTVSVFGSTSGKFSQNFSEPRSNGMNRLSKGYYNEETSNKATNLTESSPQQSESRSVKECWTERSLEGSAVEPPPDPLDMSEEAKAERWFRPVAQIKDISELSQIPDEDFPSIMLMRKGVNRFVVSKRKTPLERRLTSPQYRRNLPIMSSDPVKKDN